MKFIKHTFLLFLCLALLQGCKEEAPKDPSTATKTFGPAGGRLELDDGARVHLPQGAQTKATSISITRLPGAAILSSTFIPISQAYSLTPHGQTFASPVTLYLPYDVNLAGENEPLVRVFLSVDGGGNWAQLPFVQSSYTALVGGHTTHFSLAVVGIPLRDDTEAGGEEGSVDPPPKGSPDGCSTSEVPGCNDCKCEQSVCSLVSACCENAWTEQCVQVCEEIGGCDDPIPPEGGEGGNSGGSCEGLCGESAPDGCYCDANCVNFGDCCFDACALCGHCGGPSCGDGNCADTETCENCPADCGNCAPTCGDNLCEFSESCSLCPADCGECHSVCGDNQCTGEESCENCLSDCGPCVPSGSCIGHCGMKAPEGCYCDSECSQFNDCCADICTACNFCS